MVDNGSLISNNSTGILPDTITSEIGAIIKDEHKKSNTIKLVRKNWLLFSINLIILHFCNV